MKIPAPATPQEQQREKRSVALTSLLAALFLVTIKTIVGVTTLSLGVLSEAAHSGLDLVAAGVTYFSVRVADKPADADHQYGHGKVENFAAFIETGLLLITCGWIVWEAIHRLFVRPVHVEPSLWAFGVMVISIVIDHFRSRELGRVARKYNSQALEADALHFRTDVWSSIVVIFGLLGVLAAQRWQLTWLKNADPIAALVVAGIVVWISVQLGKRTVDALLDAAPAGLRTEVESAVATVDGVLVVERVRTRSAGAGTFIDLIIGVPRTLPFHRVHSISEQVEEAVRARIPRADVVVHMEPRAADDESFYDKVRAIAQRNNLHVHELSAHDVKEGSGVGSLILDLDVEVDETLNLREAHALADQVEKEIYRELPRVSHINTHIETLAREIAPGEELDGLARALEAYLANAPARFPDLQDCHDIQVRSVDGKVVVSFHAVSDGSLPITRVHDITQQLETHIHRRFPQIFRLTIHTEPPEER